MTMAVGFLCRDGVVIGADRQVTGANYTFPECKLISFSWANGHGILAYSGGRDTFMNFASELGSRVPDSLTMQKSDVKKLLKDCLTASLQKKETFLTIFGFWIEGKSPSLIMSNTERRIVDVADCEVIGYGDSPLTRSLLGRFRDVPHSITVHQARIYAVNFISQAKKYDGQYVGDGIDVYSVDHSGDTGERCVRVLDAGQTGTWETQIQLMNYWMDVLFSHTTNKDDPVSMQQFMERVKQFREWAGGGSEH